jgi:hypothetical protein
LIDTYGFSETDKITYRQTEFMILKNIL